MALPHDKSHILYEAAARDGGQPLRTIVFPPWLLEHGNRLPQAALSDDAYDFVTFRLVRKRSRG